MRSDVAPATLTWLILSVMHARGFRNAVLPDAAPVEHDLLELIMDTPRPACRPARGPGPDSAQP